MRPAGEGSTAPRKRSDGLVTIEKILEAGEEEVDAHGYVKFNLDRVIEKSGVSRSSVYHHFGGRDGLMAAVETRKELRNLGKGLADLDSVLDTYASGEEAFQLIATGVLLSGTDEQRKTRRRRVSSFAAAEGSAAVREVLAARQTQGTENFARMIERFRDRGMIEPVEPVVGLAYLIQSMFIGRILVDILDDADIEAQWQEAAIQTLRLVLRPKNPKGSA